MKQELDLNHDTQLLLLGLFLFPGICKGSLPIEQDENMCVSYQCNNTFVIFQEIVHIEGHSETEILEVCKFITGVNILFFVNHYHITSIFLNGLTRCLSYTRQF